MMRLHKSWYLAGVLFIAATMEAPGGRAEAQQAPADSALYARAQEMVSNGDAAGGRRIVDSLVNAATPGSPQHAEGLYWRATLASSANAAEKDYRRIVVDNPLSPRVPDALLRMGELESARGDRDAALQHFHRLTLEHPESPLHAEASYWLARTYFETNDIQHGCAANSDALALVKPSNVELKNRIAFQQQRCRGVGLAQAPSEAPRAAPRAASNGVSAAVPQEPVASAAVDSAAPAVVSATPKATVATATTAAKKSPATSSTTHMTRPVARSGRSTVPARAPTRAPVHPSTRAPKSVVKRTAGAPAASTHSGTFAVQVAAFGSRAQSEALAVKLRGRGYSAHVDGVVAPYRVRIGSYSSRAAAIAELQRLKAKQISGFVTQE